VSTSMYAAIARARARGIPVVISTRVYTGRVIPLYGCEGGVASLRALGCVLAGNLSPVKSRVLLLVALQQTTDPQRLQQFFDW